MVGRSQRPTPLDVSRLTRSGQRMKGTTTPMGAHNFAAMIQTYRRALRDHDKAFRLLAYMAHVSRDDDPEPWFGMGHAALAYHALGRDLDEHGEASQADLRAVRRGITTLLDIGAITVIRPANGRRSEHKTVCYRLHLHAPAKADERRTDDEPQASDPPDDRRTLSGPTVGRSVVHRRTLSGSPQDAHRPPKEKEENEERGEEDVVTSQGDLTTRAYPDEQADEIDHGEAGEDGPDAVRRDAAPAAIHDEDDGGSAKPQVTPVVRSTASPVEESSHSQGAPQEQGIGRRAGRSAGVPDHVARLLPPHLRPTRLRAS